MQLITLWPFVINTICSKIPLIASPAGSEVYWDFGFSVYHCTSAKMKYAVIGSTEKRTKRKKYERSSNVPIDKLVQGQLFPRCFPSFIQYHVYRRENPMLGK